MTSSDMQGAQSATSRAVPYVRSPVSLYTLEQNLLAMDPNLSQAASVYLDIETGGVVASPPGGSPWGAAGGEQASQLPLPLTLGAMRLACDGIARVDGWLLPRSPVLYCDAVGVVHIDFPGLAGFTVTSQGEVVSRAVNPY